jgi:quercetin dioxygenase-like cupin family protein
MSSSVDAVVDSPVVESHTSAQVLSVTLLPWLCFDDDAERSDYMKPQDDPKGSVIDLAGYIDYADQSVVSKTLMDKKTGTLTLFSFDAGQGLSEHTSPYDATVLVLEGEAEITVGGKTMKAQAGGLVIMPAGIPHSLRAERRFKMLLIMIR